MIECMHTQRGLHLNSCLKELGRGMWWLGVTATASKIKLDGGLVVAAVICHPSHRLMQMPCVIEESRDEALVI